MERFYIEKVDHPFNSNLKWRVMVGETVSPFKKGIFGHYLTKKKATEVVGKLEEFIKRFH